MASAEEQDDPVVVDHAQFKPSAPEQINMFEPIEEEEVNAVVELDQTPVHPVAFMQGAFEESIMESTAESADSKDAKQNMTDPEKRREQVLEGVESSKSTSRWRQSETAKFHPLWKLVAQITFGVHLLQQQLAKSDDEVVKILQTHVDEIDSFIELSTADFDLAITDIEHRIKCMDYALTNQETFDQMLDDRKYRTTIVEGNDKIEVVIRRTAKDMNDGLVDLTKGLEATTELARYLDRIGKEWTQGNTNLMNVYDAMRGNADGWHQAFFALQVKGNKLGAALVQLGGIIGQVAKRAGIASRRTLFVMQPVIPSRTTTVRLSSPPPISRYSSLTSANKPLPRVPAPNAAKEATLRRRSESIPFEAKFEHPREQAPKPPVRFVDDTKSAQQSQQQQQQQRRSRSTNSTPRTRSPARRPPTVLIPAIAELPGSMPNDEPSRPRSRRRNSIEALTRRLSTKLSPTAAASFRSPSSVYEDDHAPTPQPPRAVLLPSLAEAAAVESTPAPGPRREKLDPVGLDSYHSALASITKHSPTPSSALSSAADSVLSPASPRRAATTSASAPMLLPPLDPVSPLVSRAASLSQTSPPRSPIVVRGRGRPSTPLGLFPKLVETPTREKGAVRRGSESGPASKAGSVRSGMGLQKTSSGEGSVNGALRKSRTLPAVVMAERIGGEEDDEVDALPVLGSGVVNDGFVSDMGTVQARARRRSSIATLKALFRSSKAGGRV